MNHLGDLRLQEDIFPLFDFVSNDRARDKLYEVLNENPPSIQKIAEKQQILKTLIALKRSPLPYSQYRSVFNDVFLYLNEYKTRDFTWFDKLPIRLRLHSKIRHYERGKLIQLLLYFQKLQQQYLTDIPVEEFPETFRENLKALKSFIASFQLPNVNAATKTIHLPVTAITALCNTIGRKTSNGEVDRF